MYMPRGNFDLCRSTALPLVLLRERLRPGPDVGRSVPVRLQIHPTKSYPITNIANHKIESFRKASYAQQCRRARREIDRQQIRI